MWLYTTHAVVHHACSCTPCMAAVCHVPALHHPASLRPQRTLPSPCAVPSPWQALFLKTSDSVALPIYQVLPDAPTKIES